MLVDLADRLRGQFQDGAFVFGNEALIAVAEAVNSPHAVEEMQLHHQRADHVVETRAKPAAGDDAGACLGGIKKDLSPRPGRFEPRDLIDRARVGRNGRSGVVKEHPIALIDVVITAFSLLKDRQHRRIDPAGAERFHNEIFTSDQGTHRESPGLRRLRM